MKTRFADYLILVLSYLTGLLNAVSSSFENERTRFQLFLCDYKPCFEFNVLMVENFSG